MVSGGGGTWCGGGTWRWWGCGAGTGTGIIGGFCFDIFFYINIIIIVCVVMLCAG